MDIAKKHTGIQMLKTKYILPGSDFFLTGMV